jgi:hypothetical protein
MLSVEQEPYDIVYVIGMIYIVILYIITRINFVG